jgi:hypothetical protein
MAVMHVSQAIDAVDGMMLQVPPPSDAASPPPSSVPASVPASVALPLLLPELLPDDEPDELPDELPEELPLLLPELLPVPPSSPVLDDDVHPGSAETSAKPAIPTITADQANLFMCFSQSPLVF